MRRDDALRPALLTTTHEPSVNWRFPICSPAGARMIRSRRRRHQGACAPDQGAEEVPGDAGHHPQPTLLDIGPVVGHNVTFFGERLGCKFHVEELSKDVDRHDPRGQASRSAWVSQPRFPQADEASTGFCAGTCSTTSTKPRRRRWRSNSRMCCDLAGCCSRCSTPPKRRRRRDLHAVRRRGRSETIQHAAVSGVPRQAAATPEPRHPAHVRAAAHHRSVPAQDATRAKCSSAITSESTPKRE